MNQLLLTIATALPLVVTGVQDRYDPIETIHVAADDAQAIYAEADSIGMDFYAVYLYTDLDGDGETLEKQWMAWALDTILKAAELAEGKPTTAHLMGNIAWVSPTSPNKPIPHDELVDRVRFILEHRLHGDGIDTLVVWHPNRNDARDLAMMNAIREACDLPPITLEPERPTPEPNRRAR